MLRGLPIFGRTAGPCLYINVLCRRKAFKTVVKKIVFVIIKERGYSRNHPSLPCATFHHGALDMPELVAESEVYDI